MCFNDRINRSVTHEADVARLTHVVETREATWTMWMHTWRVDSIGLRVCVSLQKVEGGRTWPIRVTQRLKEPLPFIPDDSPSYAFIRKGLIFSFVSDVASCGA